ncbi:hypothetical protein GCM10010910_24030 [Microbacterium nanhaiense]|uniref:Uncharacterized protein n=1 Tax=Microbacterium nanhaiense TaxID=1301026 RepID=A0ABQ2N4S0_9MICO|nr:hypothetical protein GCM10010910_24030 [Microbacterium nanhaiense]
MAVTVNVTSAEVLSSSGRTRRDIDSTTKVPVPSRKNQSHHMHLPHGSARGRYRWR